MTSFGPVEVTTAFLEAEIVVRDSLALVLVSLRSNTAEVSPREILGVVRHVDRDDEGGRREGVESIAGPPLPQKRPVGKISCVALQTPLFLQVMSTGVESGGSSETGLPPPLSKKRSSDVPSVLPFVHGTGGHDALIKPFLHLIFLCLLPSSPQSSSSSSPNHLKKCACIALSGLTVLNVIGGGGKICHRPQHPYSCTRSSGWCRC